MATKISKGSYINLHGSNIILQLAEEAVIKEVKDQTYVGALLHDKAHNWPLNIDNYAGNYNPTTGALMPNECQNCGREIPKDAKQQKLCEVCLGIEVAAQAAKPKKATKKKAAKKKAAKAPAKPKATAAATAPKEVIEK